MTTIVLTSMPPQFGRFADATTQARWEGWQAARRAPGAPVQMPEPAGSTFTTQLPNGREASLVRLRRSLPSGTSLYAEPDVRALLASARAAPELVAGQCRFSGANWAECSVEHVRMVLAAPHEWQGYEVRYLYAAAAKEPAP